MLASILCRDEMTKFGSYHYQAQAQEADFQGNITLAAAGGYLLLAAGSHADENGFGIVQLQSMNRTWVLSRAAIEMKRFPRQYEHFRIDTWIEDLSRLQTNRVLNMHDADDNIIVSAAFNWVMIDFVQRRTVDLKTLQGLGEYVTGKGPLIEKASKLPFPEGDSARSLCVCYSDIDINMHVNSMRYVQWLQDLFPLDLYRQKALRRFEVNYMQESQYGDEVALFRQETAPGDYLAGARKSNGDIACKARFVFE